MKLWTESPFGWKSKPLFKKDLTKKQVPGGKENTVFNQREEEEEASSSHVAYVRACVNKTYNHSYELLEGMYGFTSHCGFFCCVQI